MKSIHVARLHKLRVEEFENEVGWMVGGGTSMGWISSGARGLITRLKGRGGSSLELIFPPPCCAVCVDTSASCILRKLSESTCRRERTRTILGRRMCALYGGIGKGCPASSVAALSSQVVGCTFDVTAGARDLWRHAQ